MPKGRYDKDTWPEEVKQFIREHASEDITMLQMLDMVNSKFRIDRDYEQIKGLYFRQKYPKKRKARDDRTLTTEQAEYMESIIKGRRSEEVTQMMRDKYGDVITLKQVRTWKKNRRLCSGVDTRIKKDTAGWNKGMKFPGRGSSTSFKSGNRPHNAVELDQISERGGYLYIKIADGRKNKNWYPLGRMIWEKENGKLPDDCRIAFLDGNPCNVDISNLAAVPINEFAIAAVNIGMVKGDPELNSAILTAAKLKAAIRRKQNEG